MLNEDLEFLEDFDIKNQEHLKRLFNLLNPDKFNSLSLGEQDLLLECLKTVFISDDKPTGLLTGTSTPEMLENLDENWDTFKEDIRESISNNEILFKTIKEDDLKRILNKAKNKEPLTEEEEAFLNSMMSSFEENFLPKDDYLHDLFNVSAVLSKDIIKNYETFKNCENLREEVTSNDLIKDLNNVTSVAPLANSLSNMLLASVLTDKSFILSKLYNNLGGEKVLERVNDILSELLELVVETSKERGYEPESVLIAMSMMVFELATASNIKIDKVLDIPDAIFITSLANEAFRGTIKEDEAIENFDKLFKTEPDSDKEKSNGSNKEKKSSNNKPKTLSEDDIRNLLME